MAEDQVVVRESGDADRLIAFADAVVAIAITLLALELPVPEGKTAHELLTSARHHQGDYLAFLVSFLVIAAMWARHHHVMRYAERSDDRLRSLNMVWLLAIVLNPFATDLIAVDAHDTAAAHALRFGFYAVLQILANVAFLAMIRHLVRAGLQSADAPADLWPETRRGGLTISAIFALSIPLFFVSRDAYVLWFAGPVVIHFARRHGLFRTRKQPTG
ncbi:MAG TPA: TMEM175 family protein [Solirubrobacteraceae bacterium]|nr:TMEM175 family protein [Solirubrobacteraceae bacterium]